MTAEFFNVQSVREALELLISHLSVESRTHMLDPREAVGRVLASEPVSPINLPEFPRSTMDGFAVRAGDTFGASATLPAYLRVAGLVKMGEEAVVSLLEGQALEIHTGGMLPPGADAVVMIERTQPVGDDEIEVHAPVAPGENVIQIGEDASEGEPLLPKGHRLRAQDIGGMLATGVLEVEVTLPPRVGILSSGDEIISPENTPAPGQIRDINAYTLAALVEQAGGKAIILGIARDEFVDYLELARAGFEDVDMLVMTAGSSVSSRDLTVAVIGKLGRPGVLQHGLAVKPGKPTILAACDGKPVIGLPGNPVSAFLVARQIVLPLIRMLLGERDALPATVNATLSANIASVTGREDTIPVRLELHDGERFAEPVFGKSNLIFTLMRADGLVCVPLNSGGLKAGSAVIVELF